MKQNLAVFTTVANTNHKSFSSRVMGRCHLDCNIRENLLYKLSVTELGCIATFALSLIESPLALIATGFTGVAKLLHLPYGDTGFSKSVKWLNSASFTVIWSLFSIIFNPFIDLTPSEAVARFAIERGALFNDCVGFEGLIKSGQVKCVGVEAGAPGSNALTTASAPSKEQASLASTGSGPVIPAGTSHTPGSPSSTTGSASPRESASFASTATTGSGPAPTSDASDVAVVLSPAETAKQQKALKVLPSS